MRDLCEHCGCPLNDVGACLWCDNEPAPVASAPTFQHAAEIAALEAALAAIERRRLARRTRWFRRPRWPGEAEKFWSLGMWGAQKVINKQIRDLRSDQ